LSIASFPHMQAIKSRVIRLQCSFGTILSATKANIGHSDPGAKVRPKYLCRSVLWLIDVKNKTVRNKNLQ
jgi:hypothetical protein